MEFFNPIIFDEVLKEEQQKIMDYMMNLYDSMQSNTLEDSGKMQNEQRQKLFHNAKEAPITEQKTQEH